MAVILKVLDGEIEIPEGYAEFLKLRRHYASVADTVRRDAANAISDSYRHCRVDDGGTDGERD